MSTLKMKVFISYLGEIQAVYHVADEQGKMIRRQPFPDIRRKL